MAAVLIGPTTKTRTTTARCHPFVMSLESSQYSIQLLAEALKARTPAGKRRFFPENSKPHSEVQIDFYSNGTRISFSYCEEAGA
jgi:hypothetical protein